MSQKEFFIKAAVLTILLMFCVTSVAPISAINNTPLVENTYHDPLDEESDITIVEDPVICFKINNLGFSYSTISVDGQLFASIELPTDSYSGDVGQAKLPVVRKMIEIPQGADPTLEVSNIQWIETSLEELELPLKIIPVQPPVPKIPDATPEFIIDGGYYTIDEFLPEQIDHLVSIGQMRGHRFAIIEITPLQYNPVTGDLILMESCEVQISLPNSNLQETTENINRYYSPSYEDLCQASFDNYGEFGTPTGEKDLEGYLIIVYDPFYDQIQPLASWKQTLGYEVTVTRTSEIPGGPTYDNIETYIDDAYTTWPIPPTYVLLVGDTSYVPTKTSGLEYGVYCSDLYYAAVDPYDYFPDLFLGRFPASSEAHVTAMVEKTLTYEQEAYPGPEFLTYATFMAGNDNYQISEGTHNYCIEHYLEPNQWQIDRLYEVTYGATTQDVRNAFNDGRILGVFSGHGYYDEWSDGPTFTQSDVNGLTNLDEYPFVFSHACLTGTFTQSECFGETWLRASDKASIFFWGAAASTWWTEDDWLEKNWFSAWWDDQIETIGGLTVQGMIYTVNQISDPSDKRYYIQAYNILGDPSLILEAIEFVWEDDVGAVSVNHPSENATGGEVTINATIENFGYNDQYDVPVSCGIYPGGEIIFSMDFEADNGGFIAGGTTTWQWGVPGAGPGSAHSGSKCWGTTLNGDYPDYCNAWVDSPPIQLPAGDSTILSFWHWYDIERGYSVYDGGNVKISTNGGGSWSILGSYQDPYPESSCYSGNYGIPNEPCFSGSSGGWQEVVFDLGDYAGQEVMIRWHFGSDSSIHYNGWYFDDVVIDTVFSPDPIYTASTVVDVMSEMTETVEFSPPWSAEPGTYAIRVKTELPGDQKPSNDQVTKVVTVGDFILNLEDFPMYEAEEPYNEMCGPAVAQMTLNYMWWNNSQYPEPPMTFDDQTWLYQSGIENNSNPNLDYFDLQGMWHVIQYNKPMPYNEYGYNFNKRHDADQNEMLKQTCLWINYTVGTYGGHMDGHPYHVPSVVPAYGDYTNWMAIRGIHTDRYVFPMPENLTIYGFWMNDPYPASLGGIGENSYKDITAFINDYYIAMTTGDYIGEYLAVLEPPESTENCNLQLGESKPRFTYFQSNLLKSMRTGVDTPEIFRGITNEWIIQAAIDGVTEQLVPFDTGFAQLFERTLPDEPFYVMTLDQSDYYIVPFNLPADNTVIVVLIDADDGSFKEASWAEESVIYLPISRDEAQQIITDFVRDLNIEVEETDDLQPELIYRKSSPYYPEWQVLIGKYGIYVDQDGVVTYIIFK